MKYQTQRLFNSAGMGDFTLAGADKHFAPDLKLEPVHTDLHLTLDLQAQSAVGFALITIQANVAGRHSLKLDAVDFEAVSVSSESGKALSFSYDDKQLQIHFEQDFTAGEQTRIKIGYQVLEPLTGIKFSKPTAALPDMPLFAITDNETERARYWFPCVDFPTVRSRMEYHLTAPESFTILANGALVDERVKDGMKTAHWRLDYPCPSYLACFAVGEFSEFVDEPLEGMPIAYFADKSYTPEQLQRTFAPTRDMLIWLQQKLAMPFPYPKYYQIAGRAIGGAMENISLVTWDDKFMLDETMAREQKYIMDLINIHEMSHSYFGDAVVSYDFAHVWLKESWATYIESVWLEDTQGKDAMDWQMAEEALRYMSEVKERYVRPIITRKYDHSWQMFDMHLYPGGAWRLHMLRQQVGDGAFWAGVRDYVNTYAGKTVKSVDFQRCIEKYAAVNLDTFFDTWFFSMGYPVLKVSFEYNKDSGRGKFIIEQQQVDNEKGIEAFKMDLDLLWQDAEGQDHRETLQLSRQEQVFMIKMSEPSHIALDPDMKALFETDFNPGDDRLRHLLQNGKTVRSIMQAVSGLAKTGKRKNLQAIREYLSSETRWGLRLHAYRELGSVGNAYAFEHLAELLSAERDDMVLEAAATACGKHRHPILRSAILKKLQQADLPYRGQMMLLAALGQQQNLADGDLLAHYSRRSGWRDLVKAGAYLGLGALHHESAVEALLDGMEAPVYFYDPKVARLSALGDIREWLPQHLEKRVSQAICEATRDPEHFVKLAAARAIGAGRISAGLPDLIGLKPLLAAQDLPVIERQIQLVQADAPGSPDKKLQTQLNQLKEQVAGMEKRLQEVEPEKD